jgi:hypothetical protein
MAKNSLDLKSFGGFEIKDADKGEVTAIVATLGVVDRDGDVFLPGSIPDGVTVKLSAYGHDIIEMDEPPVGIGKLVVKGDKALFDGRFFMTTTRGRDAFFTTKELGSDSEWSFGFVRSLTKTAPMTDEWNAQGARRLITSVVPMEASPVFIGAGIGTETLITKAKEDEDAPPDPAIEAARLENERKARELANANACSDRRFKRGPALR